MLFLTMTQTLYAAEFCDLFLPVDIANFIIFKILINIVLKLLFLFCYM